jgi:hypothetical protein
MKLSDLVSYLNQLDQHDIDRSRQVLGDHVDPMIHLVENQETRFPNIELDLARHRQRMHDAIQDLADTRMALRKEIMASIESIEVKYLADSYELYSQGMCHDSDQHILDRRFFISPDTQAYLRARLLLHSDWHYPGMILRPGLETWIQDLVALDPMYVVDTSVALLEPCRRSFTNEYQNRMRSVVITESDQNIMLQQLPQQQLGFVLAYNFFHYKPLEIVRSYLAGIYDCMRPGGTLIFTFNDCDHHGAVEMAERHYMCYTPGRLVLGAATLLGFDISHVYTIDAATTWVEAVKPGKLSSIRGGQALARIVASPEQIK